MEEDSDIILQKCWRFIPYLWILYSLLVNISTATTLSNQSKITNRENPPK